MTILTDESVDDANAISRGWGPVLSVANDCTVLCRLRLPITTTGCTTLQDWWEMSPNDPTLQETEGTALEQSNGPAPQESQDLSAPPAENASQAPPASAASETTESSSASAATPENAPSPDAPSPDDVTQAVPPADVTPDIPAPPSATPVTEQPVTEQPVTEEPVTEEPVSAPAAAAESAPAAPAPAVSSSVGERSRVTLNPTGAQDAKAVPSLQGDDSASSRDATTTDPAVPSPPPRATAPPPPVTGVEIPRAAELDPAMEAELAAAMAENPLSATINASTPGGTPAQPVDIETLQPGARLKGTIQTVGAETVFVDLGLRSPGMIQARQFPPEKPPEVGQTIDVVVDRVDAAEGSLLVSLPKARRKPAGNWDAVAQGQVVDALVTKTNKGGLEVTISNLRGFLPASQVDLGFIENLDTYVGQKLTCIITEVNPQKRNLVVSRRAFLQQERQEKEQELWKSLAVDQSMSGTVKTIKDYGAFVDLGGVDGFLHVGEISWNRISHPGDMLKVGDVIQVRILKLDPDSKKIGLGMKQLQQNPWGAIDQKYPVGATVSGRVTRTTDFGAFVELEQGVEGLIHISELDHRRVGRVTEVVRENDQVDAKVLAVEPSRKRISLSLKALKSKPETETAAAPAVEPYERKRKGPLRGGKESDQGGRGGLFGNPDDFR